MSAQTLKARGLDPLLAITAASELAELRKLRAVASAAADGRTQTDIAAKLSVTQPAIHKMLVKARHTPGLFEQTPWEIILRYAAGEISHDKMIETLAAWPWTVTAVLDSDNPLPEAIERGSWEDLGRALQTGYLTDEDYEVLFERTA